MKAFTKLADLEILALDCQATGANPGRGHLLEIGWISGWNASAPMPQTAEAASHLIQLPPQTPIPPVVQRLTGISEQAMNGAVPAEEAWRQLRKTALANAARNPSALCPTVVHFARFEAPFLHHLHTTHDPHTAFPFATICTHAIATRLLPGLPRKGIRALAGYLGHSIAECRRSSDHVLATLVIWKGLVELLRDRCDVYSLEQLTHWLSASPKPGRTKRTYPMQPQSRLSLPDQPGVYRMRRANADILYIGKAKSLKKRVNSYFRNSAAHPEHILEMLSQARRIDFSPTASALEAAVREADEIKRQCPPYNKVLRSEHRSLVFCTRDLKQHASGCDHQFRVGPLPGGRGVDALMAFGAWLEHNPKPAGDDLLRIGLPILARSGDHAPEIKCLEQGFDLFHENHRTRLSHSRSPLHTVTALGAQLRRRQLEAPAGGDAAAEIENDGDGGTPAETETAAAGGPAGPATGPATRPAWTPADVAGAIERMLMHWAHLVRRARWYCLLSESCVAWASADNPQVLKYLMMFEKGHAVHKGVLPESRKVPEPPGCWRGWRERRSHLDLAAYDRMRVVTTELRRLLCERRQIEVRLGPKARLGASELEKALQWV
jgi:DNA polymerase III subunit epsilon